MKEYLKSKRDYYIAEGKRALDNAADYLHRNCEDWSSAHEAVYLEYVNNASSMLSRALAVDDIIESGEIDE